MGWICAMIVREFLYVLLGQGMSSFARALVAVMAMNLRHSAHIHQFVIAETGSHLFSFDSSKSPVVVVFGGFCQGVTALKVQAVKLSRQQRRLRCCFRFAGALRDLLLIADISGSCARVFFRWGRAM
jgi:hypothetical protein